MNFLEIFGGHKTIIRFWDNLDLIPGISCRFLLRGKGARHNAVEIIAVGNHALRCIVVKPLKKIPLWDNY